MEFNGKTKGEIHAQNKVIDIVRVDAPPLGSREASMAKNKPELSIPAIRGVLMGLNNVL